ncbi:MAG: TadE/TadG family type IV pilus assembly protein [Anaerotardibacter sp.]
MGINLLNRLGTGLINRIESSLNRIGINPKLVRNGPAIGSGTSLLNREARMNSPRFKRDRKRIAGRNGQHLGTKRKSSGQMTIEFVVVFPVLIVIALIGTNAILFLSECASFDRVFRQTVCLYGASPGYEQDSSQTIAKISHELQENFSHDFETVSVSSKATSGGLTTYEGQIELTPTLFGSGPLSSVFGVDFPKIKHVSQITIDVYKPGILF